MSALACYRQSAKRPDRGRLVILMPKEELAAIDRWGGASGMASRTEAVRYLIREGLKAVRGNGGGK